MTYYVHQCKECGRELDENEELYCGECQVDDEPDGFWDRVDRAYEEWKDRQLEIGR